MSCREEKAAFSLKKRVKSPKIVKIHKEPRDGLIISKDEQALLFSWSSLFPSTSNYMRCDINNSCSTFGQKHDNQHGQSATSAITNSASAQCFSSFTSTWPDSECKCWCLV